MYSVDMKNIVPKKSLTFLVVKSTLDESMLWHRRLGHVNFKTINKLVKENLVMRNLHTKHFENDPNLCACLLREANTKASCIKRNLVLARTPQQNGVAERRNRTLIEAARTMLADSKLPTTFWAEAVNTACYVQNRVLVVKPHNKTPYELFRGRTPALSFMRPFGCHVTILNTLDYLGKFDGKSDEGFFVGYSLNSKTFRVYNIRTRKVEENLHIRFLEDKSIMAGDGPKWLFDIDVLTKSMNYVPVVAGTNSNDSVGTEESIGTGHSSKETGSSQDYILMPIWKDGSLFDSSLKNASNDEPQPSSDAGKKDDEYNATATHADFFGDEREVDMSNITTTYPVPSTPNTRIHKDHSLDHVIGDMQSRVLTKRMIKTTNEQGFISAVYEGKSHEDLHTCLFAYHRKSPKRNNKARLVAQGYTQEEGIDYDKVFALVSRIEAIRLFLAYASFKDFVVYQMDVKSAFLYGNIEEEIYVCQPLGFEDLEFPDRVYKVEKAYGLHQAPRAWNEMCTEFEKMMHKKFQMSSMGELTFFLGLQVTQKDDGIFISQDKYVDEILKKFGFSTVRPSKTHHFDLEAYTISDYAGASLDRKSTTGGCQFLRSRFISWQCKKQTIVANSTTEAEFVATASCCGQETTTARTLDNGEIELTATIDGKVKIVTKASVRRHLQLADSDGISSLPTTKIFEQLSLMGWERAATTATSLEAEQDSGGSPRRQDTILGDRPAQTRLIKKVKKLEKTAKSSQARGRAKIFVSNDEDDLEDPSKQGRKIAAIDQDPGISLVQHDVEIQGRYGHDMEFDFDFDAAKEVSTVEKDVSTAELVSFDFDLDAAKDVSTAKKDVSTAKPVSTASAAITTASVAVSTAKDKGKAKMDESESKTTQTKTKLQQEQERLCYEAAVRLQAELEEEERQRIARVHEAASSFIMEEWEEILLASIY
ncbi:putative ribonuclease H-like domain-containing protein [Tanacetum coccineum]